MQKRDFKYSQLIIGKTEWDTMMCNLINVKTPCLKPIVEAFATNLNRTVVFGMMPVEVSFSTRKDQSIADNVGFAVTGRLPTLFDILEPEKYSPETLVKLAGEEGQQHEEWKKIDPKVMASLKEKWGIYFIEHLIEQVRPMQLSMDAIFVSIVLESWLFFEAFVSDLWIEAIDNAPKSISNAVGIFKNWNNPDESVTLDNVRNLQFDAKTHLGSFLREVGKVSFAKFRDIKKFYAGIFGKDTANLIEKSAGGYIEAVSGVRNVIAHHAGKVDGKFKRECCGRFTEFNNLEIGDKLELDGVLVKKLRNAVIETGTALAQKIDQILLC